MADPISLIVGSLAASAAAGLKPTVEQAVKEAYSSLKTLIKGRYENVSVDVLDAKPGDKGRQQILRDDLGETQVATDAEVAAKARELFNLVARVDPDAVKQVGLDISGGTFGRTLEVDGVNVATGEGVSATGVDAKNVHVDDAATFKNISVGTAPEPKRVP